mmetsp:Transcript_4176/g.9871  ORF Transcript_4176/g.9871 Transcript_4176/m.9871 type:complete len:200 (-) Transcript_4176:1075-1674(-)
MRTRTRPRLPPQRKKPQWTRRSSTSWSMKRTSCPRTSCRNSTARSRTCWTPWPRSPAANRPGWETVWMRSTRTPSSSGLPWVPPRWRIRSRSRPRRWTTATMRRRGRPRRWTTSTSSIRPNLPGRTARLMRSTILWMVLMPRWRRAAATKVQTKSPSKVPSRMDRGKTRPTRRLTTGSTAPTERRTWPKWPATSASRWP